MAILVHFLLVFDHAAGRLREDPRMFRDSDEALAAYADMEAKHRDESRVEIVLVGADSLATVRQTHGHYFAPVEQIPVPLPIGEAHPASRAH